jgi:IS5 family transposase
LEWKGVSYTDFLLSVVGGMAGFTYLRFKRADPPCMVYWGSNPKYLMKDLGRAVAVTSASVHDSRVDLSEPGEVVYRDKGYFGVEPRGWDATMRRGVRGHPLGDADRSRNRRIGSKRRPVERVFAVLKRVLHAGHMLVASVARVRVKMVFSCLCFNLLQLGTLDVAPAA